MSHRPARTVTMADFERSLKDLLDQVEATGEPLTITRSGRPVLRLVLAAGESDDDALRARLRARVRHLGDVVSPTGEDWDGAQ